MGNNSNTDDDIAREIAEHEAFVAMWEAKAAPLRRQLAPVFQRTDWIKDQIRRTHLTTPDGKYWIVWRPNPMRHALFAELDRIAEVHGPERNLLRDMNAWIEAARKAIIRLNKVRESRQKKTKRKISTSLQGHLL